MDTTTSSDISISKQWLANILRENVATVTFTKKDGSERVMKCTLKEGVAVPHEKTTDRVKEPKDEILPVWDVEANGWRSITVPNLLTIELVVG